jgi:hypothetical protein
MVEIANIYESKTNYTNFDVKILNFNYFYIEKFHYTHILKNVIIFRIQIK